MHEEKHGNSISSVKRLSKYKNKREHDQYKENNMPIIGANRQAQTYYTNRFLETIAPELVYGDALKPKHKRPIKVILPVVTIFKIELLNDKQTLVTTKSKDFSAIIPISNELRNVLSINKKAYVYAMVEKYQFVIKKLAPIQSW